MIGVALALVGATTLAVGLGLLVSVPVALIAGGGTLTVLGLVVDWE